MRLKDLLGPVTRVKKKKKKKKIWAGESKASLRRLHGTNTPRYPGVQGYQGYLAHKKQGYLAHKKLPPPKDHRRALGMVLL